MFWEQDVSDKPGDQMRHEIDMAAMAGALDAALAFQDVVDGFDNRALAQQDLVPQGHQFVLHVLFDASDELQALFPQLVEQRLGDIAFVAEHFPGEAVDHVGHGFAIVDVAGGEFDGEQFAPVVNDQMQLEAEEPASRGFAALGDIAEHAMRMDAMRVADFETCGVDEGDAGGVAHMREQERAQRRQGGADLLHKALVGRQAGKIGAIVVQAEQVEVLKGPKMRKVKEHQNGHHFAYAKTARPIALAFGINQQFRIFRRRHKVVDLAKDFGSINGGTHALLPY